MTYSNTYSSPSSPTNFNPFSGMGMRKGGRPSLFPGSGDGSTLSLDFTTGVLDPRLTFSRASTATFVNSSGYVEYAGANTAPYSESLSVGLGYSDNAILSRSTTTSPTGNTAVVFYPTIELDYHRLQFSSPIAMAGATTISVYVKQIGSDYRAGINAVTYIGASVIFSLVGAGSVVGSVGGTAPNRAATITKVTDDGWYRITLTGTYNTISSVYVFMASSTSTDSTGLNFLGVSLQGIAIWGLQINSGSTAQTYYPTTTAAYHAPRFDYSPTTIGEPRGLLIEGQTANLCTYSNDFNDGAWVKDGVSNGALNPTVDPTYSATGPDGASTVKRIIFNKTNGSFSRIRRQINVSNATYTMSVWMKANTANGAASTQNVGLRMGSSAGVNCVVTTTWQRFTHTFAVVDGSAEFQIMLWDNITGPPANDETADVLVYGAQTELGSGASSYIPTGASQVTRNADICYMPISTIGFSTSGGTFFTSFYRGEANLGLNQSGSAINTDYADTRWLGIGSGYGSTTFGFGAWNGALNKTGAGVFGLNKAAGSYASWVTSTTGAFTVNGATAVTGTLSNLGTTPNYLMIGSASQSSPYNGAGLRDFLNNSIRSIKYFPTAFTAAQLQTLTTP